MKPEAIDTSAFHFPALDDTALPEPAMGGSFAPVDDAAEASGGTRKRSLLVAMLPSTASSSVKGESRAAMPFGVPSSSQTSRNQK